MKSQELHRLYMADCEFFQSHAMRMEFCSESSIFKWLYGVACIKARLTLLVSRMIWVIEYLQVIIFSCKLK